GQKSDDRSRGISLLRDERGIELLSKQIIEIGMADVMGRDAALLVPRLLKWQIAQHMINRSSHPPDAPTGPGPQLRRHEKRDWDTFTVGCVRQPRVTSGIVEDL